MRSWFSGTGTWCDVINIVISRLQWCHTHLDKNWADCEDSDHTQFLTDKGGFYTVRKPSFRALIYLPRISILVDFRWSGCLQAQFSSQYLLSDAHFLYWRFKDDVTLLSWALHVFYMRSFSIKGPETLQILGLTWVNAISWPCNTPDNAIDIESYWMLRILPLAASFPASIHTSHVELS